MSEGLQEIIALRSRLRLQTVLLAASVLISLVAFLRTTPRSTPSKLPADEIVTHGLTVVDSNGKMRAAVGSAQDGASVTLFDEHERPRMSMAFRNHSGPSFVVNDPAGGIVGELLYDANGSRLELTSSDGKKAVIKP